MLVNAPYPYILKYIRRHQRRENRSIVRDDLPVFVKEVAPHDVEVVGHTRTDLQERTYRLHQDRLYIEAAYNSGPLVPIADFQALVDQLPHEPDGLGWNAHDFPKLKPDPWIMNFMVANRLENIPIRKYLSDDQEERAAYAARFYRDAFLAFNGGILIRAAEPVWEVSWDDLGKWHIKCQAAPGDHGRARYFHITELDRAKRFVRDMMEGEVASAPDWADFGDWPYPDGAPMIDVALEIGKILPKPGNARYLGRSSPPTLIVEATHADLQLQPEWLSSDRSSPWNEFLRRRWLFEWARLENSEWWILHRQGSDALADFG